MSAYFKIALKVDLGTLRSLALDGQNCLPEVAMSLSRRAGERLLPLS